VARRRFNAFRKIEKLRKKGKDIQPVKIEGRTIARSFWGKGWCDHLESFSDFENRLPRGRTYVRNGSVCHLSIKPGRIEALVSGSAPSTHTIRIKKLKPAIWKFVKKKCSGRIGSMLELLQGKLSDQVMTVVTDRKQGLFPQPREIELACSCPDWAVMCKHVAAVLYGVGSRLDSRPELLFLLRDVDAQELISTEMAVPSAVATGDRLDDDQLGDIFGIDLEGANEGQPAPNARPRKQQHAGKRAAIPSRDREGAVVPRRARRKRTPARGQSKISKRAKRKAPIRKKRSRTATEPRASARAKVRTTEPRASTSAIPKIRPTGKSVVRLRKQLGLSVANFARRLDVSAASVYRWEATTGQLKLQAQPLATLAELQRQARRMNSE
jgi:uncharacterized Zn finger protein/DNA-binding transcriptional regulator YiaG